MRSTANKSTTPRMNPSWQKRSGGRKPMPCTALHQRTRQRVFLSGSENQLCGFLDGQGKGQRKHFGFFEAAAPHSKNRSPHNIRRYAGRSTYYRGFRRKVYGDNTTKYAQNHWDLSKVFPERGRLTLMNVQISTSGCVLCVCGEKTVLPRKEIPKNTQDTTVNLS